MEGRDDVESTTRTTRRLPQIMQGEPAEKRGVTPEQHFTQPPPRYTEATLVKRMEELGIGRPSTYASIVSTIQDREYVRKDKNRLIPEDKGRLVTAFLANYFGRYVDYDFTADLETRPRRRVGRRARTGRTLLARFWRDFSAALAETEDLRISEVLDKINEVLEPHLFPLTRRGSEPRRCKVCGTGRLHLKTSRNGSAFIGCSNYPECRYTRPLVGGDEGDAALDGKILGTAARAQCSRRTADAAGHAAQGPLRPLCPARRGAADGPEAAARRRSRRAGRPVDADARAGAGAPVAAAPGRAASRGRRAGRGRDRPLRAVREARHDLCQHHATPRRSSPSA